MAGAVRTGGKGTVRRKKKAVHKTTSTDDKRLQSTLKRLGVNTIPGIEEVNIFKGDDVIHFLNPKGESRSHPFPNPSGCCRLNLRIPAEPEPLLLPLSHNPSLFLLCSPSLHCRQHLRRQRTFPDQE